MAEAALMTGQAHGLKVRLRQVSPIPLDVTIECAPREVLAIIGPSGSGKSTILRSIAGLCRPDEGHIECGGEVWLDTVSGTNLTTARRRIGMVFQNYALFPHLSALENVLEGMDHPSASDAHERARQLLEKVNLSGLDARLPHQLSGGQQQRVAVARALARDPHVLLLDEPFSAVDRATRERLYNELAYLRTSLNMPVIFVTHDLEEAAMLADRITIISHGTTLQTGAPMSVMQNPATVEVARLVGLKNVFEAEVVRHCDEPASTMLSWNGITLNVGLQTAFPEGARVAWSIPEAGVLLMSRFQSQMDSLDNLVEGKIDKIVMLGNRCHIQVSLCGQPEVLLAMTVPRHLVDSYALSEGYALSLRLRGPHIHLMPLGGVSGRRHD